MPPEEQKSVLTPETIRSNIIRSLGVDKNAHTLSGEEILVTSTPKDIIFKIHTDTAKLAENRIFIKILAINLNTLGVVGHFSLKIRPPFFSKEDVLVGSGTVEVNPDWQNRGIGSSLNKIARYFVYPRVANSLHTRVRKCEADQNRHTTRNTPEERQRYLKIFTLDELSPGELLIEPTVSSGETVPISEPRKYKMDTGNQLEKLEGTSLIIPGISAHDELEILLKNTQREYK